MEDWDFDYWGNGSDGYIHYTPAFHVIFLCVLSLLQQRNRKEIRMPKILIDADSWPGSGPDGTNRPGPRRAGKNPL